MVEALRAASRQAPHQSLGCWGGGAGPSSGSRCPYPEPHAAGTHSACTARRCSSWSPAVVQCSHGLRSGEGAPCTRGCASGHTRCCRRTTCSTPSTPRPLLARCTVREQCADKRGHTRTPRGGERKLRHMLTTLRNHVGPTLSCASEPSKTHGSLAQT